jgi:hypothetical protein
MTISQLLAQKVFRGLSPDIRWMAHAIIFEKIHVVLYILFMSMNQTNLVANPENTEIIHCEAGATNNSQNFSGVA